MTHQAAYNLLVQKLRKEGWAVWHVKTGSNYLGAIYPDESKILISNDLGWKLRLLTLAHEYGHVCQLPIKKWKRFFNNTDKFPNTVRNRLYIEDAEVDASKRAVEILKDLDVHDIVYDELNEKGLEKLRPIWYRQYLKKPKK